MMCSRQEMYDPPAACARVGVSATVGGPSPDCQADALPAIPAVPAMPTANAATTAIPAPRQFHPDLFWNVTLCSSPLPRRTARSLLCCLRLRSPPNQP